MTESKFPKRRAFAMQKPRRTEKPEGRRTERQIAADKRRRQERHARGNVRIEGTKTPEKRMAPLAPGRVRITSLIVDELTRALSVILKLDGPADVLMKLFFKSNPKLGMRDRGLIAEGIYYALRHYASIRWAMRPVRPDRAPRLAALVALARQHGLDAIAESSIGPEAGPLKNVLEADLSKAPAHVRAELPQWLYDLVEAQYDDTDALYPAMLEGAPLDLRVNLLKATREEVLDELARNGVEAFATPYSPEGVRLPTKPGLTQWAIYKDGKVDVQDEGSQLIARLVQPRRRRNRLLLYRQCNCASQLKAGNVAIQLLYLLRIHRTFIEIHLIYTEETLLRSNRAFTNFTARLPIFTAPASTLFFQSMLRLFNWISNCLIFCCNCSTLGNSRSISANCTLS